jgi:hypothetical protein
MLTLFDAFLLRSEYVILFVKVQIEAEMQNSKTEIKNAKGWQNLVR